MESKDIIVFVLVITVTGISLYRRYLKKRNTGRSRTEKLNSSVLGGSLSKEEDNYEPYIKK